MKPNGRWSRGGFRHADSIKMALPKVLSAFIRTDGKVCVNIHMVKWWMQLCISTGTPPPPSHMYLETDEEKGERKCEIHRISRHVVSICLPPTPPGLILCLEVTAEQRHTVSLSDEITSFCELLSYEVQANLQPLHDFMTLSTFVGSHREDEGILAYIQHRFSNCSLPQNNQIN